MMDIIRFENLPVPDMARWLSESSEKPSKHWERVSCDTQDARSLTLIVAASAPYLPTAEGVTLSSFYVTSNALHEIAGDKGLALPVKPLISGYGIGAYGRSGLIAIPGIGTRFAAAVIKSDAEPDEKWVWNPERPLDKACADCRMCVESCPNGALIGNGRLETDMCLRAQAQFQEPRMPDASRDMLGTSAWGCDICQDVCPRNTGVTPVKMPEELEQALLLEKLLAGDVEGLGKWLGSNYARPARMQARGCLVAANMGRSDLLPMIRKLLNSPVDAVRDCAEWAINKLENGGKENG